MFPKEGKVNEILNDFANFIFSRKDREVIKEHFFVTKLKECHDFKTPLALLQERIDKRLIDFSSYASKGVLQEIIEAIEFHSK